MRAAAAVLIVLAAGVGGCVESVADEREWEWEPGLRPPHGAAGHTIELERPDPRSPSWPADATRPARDARGPPLTLNGIPAHGLTFLVRERVIDFEVAARERWPCGGAALAVPTGAPDPRPLGFAGWSGLAYAASFAVTDHAGRVWVTDRYDRADAPGDLARSVFVANLHGREAFTPDDGRRTSSCPAQSFGDSPFNVLVYAMELDGDLDLYFSGTARPPEPASRAWWGEGPPPAWTAPVPLPHRARGAPADATLAAHDARAPLVRVGDGVARAMPLLLRDLHHERDPDALDPVVRERAPCHGAVVAAPAGARYDPTHPDARDRWRYAESAALEDESGRAWIVDRYVDALAEGPDAGVAYVANLHGGAGFLADEGGACPPAGEGARRYNVLLHPMGPPMPLDAWWTRDWRPPEPASRTWWPGGAREGADPPARGTS